MKAPKSDDEQGRLDALRRYEILGTSAESSFDDFTALASFVCNTPIALISFVDSERQWFKSKIGIDVDETPRDVSFCAHAILHEEVLVVNDTLTDARFSDNTLVTGQPHIRFYAGAPLITPTGHEVGTLCVIDKAPNALSSSQIKMMEALGRQVVVQLELRVALRTIKTLQGLIPICSYCKRIRKDQDYWQTIEKYIQEHSDVQFSHGICPTCYVDSVKPELDRLEQKRR